MNAIIPIPRCPVVVRKATEKDIPFIDTLHKMHGDAVGWMPLDQLEGKLALGHVIIAEHDAHPRTQLGYCISQDKYMGRDDVGVVYQLNVMPVRQRHLVGATLIKHVFENAAYGCRLFCCWCAQELAANYFWEGIGFIPLAFRTGGRTKKRTLIFWQRRIREGDTTTPYWYPSETKGGAIREDRLVFPIPPGVHWRDAKPIVLPGMENSGELKPLAIPDKRPARPKGPFVQKIAPVHSKSVPVGKVAIMTGAGTFKHIDRADYVPEPVVKAKPASRARKPKNDPKHAAMARELRDRYLEHYNGPNALPAPEGKYQVCKQIAGTSTQSVHLLPAA